MAPRSFLPLSLPEAVNFATAPRGVALEAWPPGVRVHLGVEHEDVHVAARRQHVVEPAEADVVGPAVAPDDPHAIADQRVGHREQQRRRRVRDVDQRALQLRHAFTL